MPSLELRIRPGLESDAAAIAGILRATEWFESMAGDAPEQTERRISESLRLQQAAARHSIFVAEVPVGAVVGYAAVHWLSHLFLSRPEGNLSELFVMQAYRGRGVGQRLLEAISIEAKRRDCYRLTLVTNRTRESYCRQFYAKSGWVERREMANFVFQVRAPQGFQAS
jgi:GNAT superfamily N-acetyltransferase